MIRRSHTITNIYSLFNFIQHEFEYILFNYIRILRISKSFKIKEKDLFQDICSDSLDLALIDFS